MHPHALDRQMPRARCQVNFQTRSPWQLASTLGFVLDRGESGHFMGLKPHELTALHECLTWGRQPGNNPVLRFFGTTFEDFSDACRTLAAKWKHLLPAGNNRVKVRMTGKDKVKVTESTLGSTLGEESTGMVVPGSRSHVRLCCTSGHMRRTTYAMRARPAHATHSNCSRALLLYNPTVPTAG